MNLDRVTITGADDSIVPSDLLALSQRYPTALRYQTNAVGWWLHDVLVHPFTGTLGLIGRLCGSLRLMALAHHVHNASAPSNDVFADFIEASIRAGCNESPDNPQGSATPDEQRWASEQAARITGRKGHIPHGEALRILKGAHVKPWDTQSRGGQAPQRLSKVEAESGAEERGLAQDLEAAELALQRLLNRTFNRYEIRDLGEEGTEDLRRQARELTANVERTRKALLKERAGTSVRDLLNNPKPPTR